MIESLLYNQGMHFTEEDVVLVYNLGSPLKVNDLVLNRFEIYLVNSLEEVAITPLRDSINYAIYKIDHQQLLQLCQFQRLVFTIDEKQAETEHYKALQTCLSRLLLAKFSDELTAHVEYEYYAYQLVLMLVRQFRISKLSLVELSLKEQLEAYVQLYFQEDLSLEQIGADFYMTPQYFSKRFKMQVGETFYKYLTRVRVAYAKKLLSCQSGNMLQIALASGFANSAVFNRHIFTQFRMAGVIYQVF